MKIVKIIKSYNSGTKEKFLVLLDKPYSNDDINSLVEEWCENEPSGMNYGYGYEWEFVEDENIIKDVLITELKSLNNKISTLENRKIEIEKFLK